MEKNDKSYAESGQLLNRAEIFARINF